MRVLPVCLVDSVVQDRCSELLRSFVKLHEVLLQYAFTIS